MTCRQGYELRKMSVQVSNGVRNFGQGSGVSNGVGALDRAQRFRMKVRMSLLEVNALTYPGHWTLDLAPWLRRGQSPETGSVVPDRGRSLSLLHRTKAGPLSLLHRTEGGRLRYGCRYRAGVRLHSAADSGE